MSAGGLSTVRLGRMHDVMAGYIERGDVPGIVTLASRRGETHVDPIGMKAVGGSDPIRRDTIFRISSLTKPLAAAATMILLEECKLRLDEPVDRLLPELADRQVLKRLDGPLDEHRAREPADHRARPADPSHGLRLHHGAAPDAYPILAAVGEQQLGMGPPKPPMPHKPDEWIRRFTTPPLMHQPGKKWMYQMGFSVLSVLIARRGPGVGDVLPRTHLLPTRHEGYRIQRADCEARPAGDLLPGQSRNRGTRDL
jgi:CubicO group peptidase (beta-lactamase class C family)